MEPLEPPLDPPLDIDRGCRSGWATGRVTLDQPASLLQCSGFGKTLFITSLPFL